MRVEVTGPGIYRMTAEEYHADPCPEPSLSAGTAKVMLMQSPAHAWTGSKRLNPNFVPEERDSFDLGSAAHALLMEGDDRMEIIRANDFKTVAAREARDAARRAGKHPILEAKYPKVLKMREVALQAIAANEDLGGITLADGVAEPTYIWQEGSIWCRARPDWRHNDGIALFDYKSTAASAHPDAWIRTMSDLWGDVQGAWYLRGHKALGGAEDAKFVFIVQEVEEPFACCLIGLAPAFIELGNVKMFEAMELWRRCISTGKWPAYPNRIFWIAPPPYVTAKWDGRSIGVDAAPPQEGDALDVDALRRLVA